MDQNDMDHMLNEKAVGNSKFTKGILLVGKVIFWCVVIAVLGNVFIFGALSLFHYIHSDLVCIHGLGLTS